MNCGLRIADCELKSPQPPFSKGGKIYRARAARPYKGPRTGRFVNRPYKPATTSGRPYMEEKKMDPKMDPKMLAAFLLIERIITDGPEIINSISAAWQKVDPTAEDFDALVTVMEAQRPKDPLKKQ